jgi:hypothetical protein
MLDYLQRLMFHSLLEGLLDMPIHHIAHKFVLTIKSKHTLETIKVVLCCVLNQCFTVGHPFHEFFFIFLFEVLNLLPAHS